MGFWSDLWQGTKRLFSNSCPSCKTNNADLPPDKKIMTRTIEEHPHTHVHWERDKHGNVHPHTRVVWNKTKSHQCQICGHKWTTHEYNQPFAG